MTDPVSDVKASLKCRFLSADPGMIERFGDPFRPFEPDCKVIQFDQPLTPAQLQRAGGQTRQTFSLRILGAMPHLKSLFLVRHKKHLPVISDLGNRTNLGLSGITLSDLSLPLSLTKLRDLSIFLGGTTNLVLLPRLGSLEELSLMRITKLSDLGVLGDLSGLTVDEATPGMAA